MRFAFVDAIDEGSINVWNELLNIEKRNLILERHFWQLLNMSSHGDSSTHGVCYAVKGALCHEHLMESELSGMDVDRHVACLPLTFGQDIVNYNRKLSTDLCKGHKDETSTEELYRKFVRFMP